MKRDKLYTINKGNKNLFAYAGSLNSIAAADKSNNPWDYADDLSTTAQFLGTSRGQAYANTKNALGITKAQNPFSQMNIGGTLTAAAPIVGGAVGGLLSGGMHSGVGNIMGGLGKAASAIPGPYGAAISAGLQIAGGAINGLFGEKVDQEKLAKNNAGTSYLNNFSSNAATFDAVQGPQTQLAVQNAYKGGIFNKSAKRKNAAARADRLAAQSNAFAQVTNNVGNLVDSQMDNMLANYSAFGGALDLMQSNNYIDAINNRSNAIAKNNMQPYSSPSLFGPRELYSCGGQIKPNKYEFGGLEASFVDNFAKDPLAAVLDYNRGIEQRAAAKEASEAAAAQEAMINELKLGLQKAQAENEGLWAMYGDQQKTLDALNDWRLNYTPAESASSTIEEAASAPVTEAPVSAIAPIEPLSFTPQTPSKRHIYDELPELLRKAGLNIRVTSGYRSPASQKRFKTTNSWHPRHGAVDIVPQGKTTFEDIERVVVSNPEIRNYMLSNGYGFLDETNRTAAGKALMQKTGASGNHFHFGKDTSARNRYRKLVGMKAFGGELGTNGSDFTNGLLEINAGGSHEDNPFEGVQLGVDQNGVPNLVEEGETVFNDYVFSKRMVVPDFMKKQLGLGSAKDDITFADASKKIAQESVERPNDPISQAGLEAGLAKLAEIQETERMRMRAEEEIENAETASLQSEPVVAACGGKLNKKYPDGGYLWDDFWKETNPTSKLQGRPDNKYKIDTSYKGNVGDREKEKDYIAFTNYILDGATPEERLNYFKWIDANTGRKAGKYIDANGNLVSDWRNMYTSARNDGLWGIQHYVPHKAQSAVPATPETPVTPKIYHAVVGDDDYLPEDQSSWVNVGDEVERRVLNDRGDTVIYHAGKGPGADEAATPAQQSTPASADITEKQPKPYQTWMRYAPIVGTGIATMTDLLGLTNKPDYSYADKIEALAERAGYAPNIRAPYIGDYMRYTPFDRLFYANQLQANSRATDRGLMNTSGGNRGAAQAGMLANGYNSQLGLGNLYRQAEEYNRGQYERTKAFNRGTNQFNAQMGLEADMANARYRQMASQYQMQGLGQAAAMRQAEDARTGAARSANFTNFLNNLGNLGRENFALNQILSSRDANNGYYLDNEGLIHRNGKVYAEVKNPSAFGGEVERYLKNKKKVRRSK